MPTRIRLLERIRNNRAVRIAFRYTLPVFAILAALLSQGILQQFIPKEVDFPYAFFYLIAAFLSAWYGGYVPGAIACLVTLVGLPMATTHSLHLSPSDVSRLVIFMGVSFLISRVANTQRRAQQVLRTANDELDRRVQVRTSELDGAVAQLRSEIAERQKTLAALQESEERVGFSLEAAAVGRWDWDLVTRTATRSLIHDQIFGYDALLPEWNYDMFLEHIVPEDRARVVEQFEASVRDQRVCDFECRIRRPDQSIRWIWVRGKIRQHGPDGALSMLGVIGDITNRKLAEEKLRTQIERLNLLDQITRAIGERQDLRSIFQVVVRSLEDNLRIEFGCVCLYDPASNALTVVCVGLRDEALAMELALTEQAHISVEHNGLWRCMRGELVYEPDTTELDFAFPRRLAAAGLRSLVAAPLPSENGVLGVLLAARRQPNSFTSTDCEFLRQLSHHVALAAQQSEMYSALQKAYDDLRLTQQTVQEQDRLRALGQMASGIAHDINNALSPVSLYTESLLAREPNLSTRAREYLETIQRAVDDVAHTVGRMREFYRKSEPQLLMKPVDINRMVQEVLDLSRARWSDMPLQRGVVVQVRTELGRELPPFPGIESEVREALVNLIFNAVDAMPNGGMLTLRTVVDPGAGSGPIGVRVDVEDSGIGMDEETRRRCLEPFFTTKGERGTGLGLAMVYGVAQRLNARLEIESALGKGTRVSLIFPKAETNAEKALQTYVTRKQASLRVLVVDDDPLLIKSLRDTLEADGHHVTTANGGQQGIDACRAAEEREEPFTVVITDLGMPYVDGRKVATAVKRIHPSMPVILLTGWGQRMEAEQDIPSHVDRVLNKPPKLHDLRVAFSELVTNGHSPSAQVAGSDHAG